MLDDIHRVHRARHGLIVDALPSAVAAGILAAAVYAGYRTSGELKERGWPAWLCPLAGFAAGCVALCLVAIVVLVLLALVGI